MSRTFKFASLGLVLSSLLVLAGCFNNPGPGTDKDKDNAAPARDAKRPEADHAHKPGQHGGILVSIGTDSYHAEAVFEKGGTLRLYLLGKDETRIQEVDLQTLSGFIKATGDPEAEPFALEADPTPDDSKGMTSRFTGKIPARLVGKHLEVTIPNLRIGKERFRISFQSAGEPGGDHSDIMPPPAEDERTLYLTPGGKYTTADIQANGNTSAKVKYQGVKTEHNDRPQPGDKICPISKTKANPKITWIVGGKVYEFCCPPCVDEFVSTAKEKPEQIHNPESYRKQ
jgi:hypothetical protein